ncbi:MAG: hypothetical protein CTY31_04075 [Hyphomicrobium sp.]|nr:MAG: hypothetical protein CTY31_04075 [Hyphomicrobium sp.]
MKSLPNSLRIAAALLLLCTTADDKSIAASERNSKILWFANCEFEANRYFSCRYAAPEIEAHIKSRSSVHPGIALTEKIKSHFFELGCDYRLVDEAFRVNGVFYSFDTRAFDQISCSGKSAKPKFNEEKATIFDLIEFWFDFPG